MSALGAMAQARPAVTAGVLVGVGARAPVPKRSRETALAFFCAPAVPAALAALVAAGMSYPQDGMASAIGTFFGVGACLAVGGYLSALLIAVPLYCLALRRRAIPPAASILLGGATAAAPWAAVGVASGEDELMIVAAATFGLGCVGGLVFALVRDGWPRAGADAAEGARA